MSTFLLHVSLSLYLILFIAICTATFRKPAYLPIILFAESLGKLMIKFLVDMQDKVYSQKNLFCLFLLIASDVPGVFCAKRASWITASLGWTATAGAEAEAGEGSGSVGTGEPSRDRLSGVCTPLEWADSTPMWLGEAGALLEQTILKIRCLKNKIKHFNSW